MSISASARFKKFSRVVPFSLLAAVVAAQTTVTDPASQKLPNPNPTVIKGWGPLPDGRTWGSTAGVDIGPDGQHLGL